ncbi:hypothetical protein GLI01_27170 [Gluconacetobacter liquefaciens]|uniref:Uncharacterized protein n=1 Tax=Gluconacetobacter liquefaciens TaxID=89584 RepID=A0A370FXG7_GLULI|nr:hypothetical protein [Gluconacetobacter liquefaciens]MBB2188050.1 hypothetical protein [Gluconacetobacter liquefaciens]RDI36155.1 hypothetical protein C7453_11236 [Gluconacetobacter liquefaciens]GBQ97284.1 hypothetical protein AA0522_0936 [Gluconacetobacter liquefaciens NRIC 0522]GEB38682.1 hypothetical protein GLI01_27170 [Gluconacetobacter liquefaciens]
MQRHLSTGSTLISALLAHDRNGHSSSPRRNRAGNPPDHTVPGRLPSPSPRPHPARTPLGSRSGHPLGALIQIIAQGHADMME